MKRYYYQCDCAGILIGKVGFYAHFYNGIGDGCFMISIYGKDEEMPKSYVNFIDTVEGNDFEILSYDCNPEASPVAVCHLNGRYAVYNDGNGNMALKYWGETKLEK